MATSVEALNAELVLLTEEQLQQVGLLVRRLRSGEPESGKWFSESALAAVWDNLEDDIYNDF